MKYFKDFLIFIFASLLGFFIGKYVYDDSNLLELSNNYYKIKIDSLEKERKALLEYYHQVKVEVDTIYIHIQKYDIDYKKDSTHAIITTFDDDLLFLSK